MSRTTHRRRLAAISFAALVAVLPTACGDDDDTPGAGATTTAAATTEPATSAPATTAEPATTAAPATDGAGEPAGDPAGEPMRIVSLSPSATEMAFALGAGDRVVAVDDQSNFPEEALSVQTALSGYTPNVEAIAGYEPDLVLHDGTTDLGTQLDGLGVEHWVGAAPSTLDDVYDQVADLGAVLGLEAEAEALVAEMREQVEAALDAAGPMPEAGMTFFHELDPTLYSVTSNTFIGEIYAMFGLRNIADTAEGTTDYPQLSPEFVISQDPDLIFLADTKCCGESAESVAARPGWATIAAVADGNVVELDDDIASRWGPRIVELIEAVAAAVQQAAVPA